MTEIGDKLFQTVFLIGVFGQDEEELKQALDTIQQVACSNDLMIDKEVKAAKENQSIYDAISELY